ncbi:hypothetical protein GF357_03875 [Candidatus Dojkabacteria bacterium]|nr:hypothetical protein [Candidatus Dojkabacteria bacterium]
MKTVFPKGTKVVGPYSPATISGNLLFVSGQIGMDKNMDLIDNDVTKQAQQALKNLKEILEAGGSAVNKVLKCTIYLIDINDYSEVNTVYAEFFGDHAPARAAVEVANLPKKAKIEVECIAEI